MAINGPTGTDHPHRRGIHSAMLDGRSPLNVLGGIPTNRYGLQPAVGPEPLCVDGLGDRGGLPQPAHRRVRHPRKGREGLLDRPWRRCVRLESGSSSIARSPGASCRPGSQWNRERPPAARGGPLPALDSPAITQALSPAEYRLRINPFPTSMPSKKLRFAITGIRHPVDAEEDRPQAAG